VEQRPHGGFSADELAAAGARGRAVGLYYLLRGLAVFPSALVGGRLWTLAARRLTAEPSVVRQSVTFWRSQAP